MPKATKADYDRINVGDLLSGIEQICWKFSNPLHAKADELAKDGDAAGAEVLSLLSLVCSYAMRADDGREPFGPRWYFGDRHSASIDDLVDEQIEFLAEICGSITINELRARVADVLFVRRRHQKFARIALDAYLASAAALITPEHWAESSYRYVTVRAGTPCARLRNLDQDWRFPAMRQQVVDARRGMRVDAQEHVA